MIINLSRGYGIAICISVWLGKSPISILDGKNWSINEFDGVLGWKYYRWIAIGIINIELMWEYK